jgi:hypothetical protein
MVLEPRKCLHLYHYFRHEELADKNVQFRQDLSDMFQRQDAVQPRSRSDG